MVLVDFLVSQAEMFNRSNSRSR